MSNLTKSLYLGKEFCPLFFVSRSWYYLFESWLYFFSSQFQWLSRNIINVKKSLENTHFQGFFSKILRGSNPWKSVKSVATKLLQFFQNKIRHFIIQMQPRIAAIDTMIPIWIKIRIVLFIRRNQGICHFDWVLKMHIIVRCAMH